METFRVVLEGGCLNGFEPEKVKIDLARLTRQTESKSAELLSGIQTTIKSGVDKATGERYLIALRAIGVTCRIELVTIDVDENFATALPPVKQSVTQETPEKAAVKNTAQPKSATKKRSFIVIFGGGFIVIMFVCAIALMMFAPAPKNTGGNLSFFKNEKISSSAYQLIKGHLQSPSSFTPVSESVLWQGKYQTRAAYIVKVEYDAQNGFGAMLRDCQYVSFTLEDDKINWNVLFYLTDCFTGLTKEKEVELLNSVAKSNFPVEEQLDKKVSDGLTAEPSPIPKPNGSTSAAISNEIENKKSAATRFGTIEISSDNAITRNGQVLFSGEYQESGRLTFYGLYPIGKSDALLIQSSGGTACPLTLYIVTLSSSSSNMSKQFGTCSERIDVSVLGESLSIAMPGYQGTSSSQADHERATKEKNIFVYSQGVISKNSVAIP